MKSKIIEYIIARPCALRNENHPERAYAVPKTALSKQWGV